MPLIGFNKNFRPQRLKSGLLLLLLLSTLLSFSQERKRIDIIYAGYAQPVKNNANAQQLVDSVHLIHNNIQLWCDTAYMYTGTNKVDAIGNVHINQGDSIHLYADKINYNGDNNLARAIKNVQLVNKTTKLYTDTLDYDLNAKIGYYDDSGTIIDSTTTITSKIGRYYADENLMYLYIDVFAFSDEFILESDSINYNTVTKRINITGPTTISDTVNNLYAENGWYDSETGEAELLKNPQLSNKNQNITAKYIHYNKENKTGEARGAVKIEDIENQSIILGRVANYNNELETAVVTDSAVYINYNETDTLFLHADTLRMIPDTIEDEKIINAYHGVRFFKTDLQGICDSMVYYTRDSLVQLHRNPVIWSDNHQLSANLIEMKQHSDAPDEIRLTLNSFIISKQDSGRFDQIKGKEMIGYITNKKLTKINVDGNGQTLYYAREKENIIGLNKSESSKISIEFRDGEIDRIIFLSKPVGELKPLLDLKEQDKELSGFDWKIKLRPLSKFDIFKQDVSPEKNP
ncbi:MAG: LPS export ABC transporter periplasmic protein LptC [Prolixibacteraceae bacterium]|nr:LPS export ABC transporter periplasmic protein LptC [Prolixibacteraceae bacterium]